LIDLHVERDPLFILFKDHVDGAQISVNCLHYTLLVRTGI